VRVLAPPAVVEVVAPPAVVAVVVQPSPFLAARRLRASAVLAAPRREARAPVRA
jgi:hypothetical protein